MKSRIALLLVCVAVGAVVHSVIDSMPPARVQGTTDLPPVVAQGSLPAGTRVPTLTPGFEIRQADGVPTAVPSEMSQIERQSERFAALGKHAAAFELTSAAAAAVADADDEVRVQAIELLGDARRPEYVAILAVALADQNSEVRIASLHALVRHGTDEALGVLRAGLPGFDEETRQFAFAVLADRGDEPVP